MQCGVATTSFLVNELSRWRVVPFSYILTRDGRSKQLDSDGGPQFMSDAFSKFLRIWGVKHQMSSSYYPQSNGRAEVAVKSAKRMLQDNVGPNGMINSDRVACAVLQYHNTPLQDGTMSPSQLLFGRALSDFLPVNPRAYRLHPYWVDQINNQTTRSLHHKRLEKRYNFGTRHLRPLELAQNVLIQEQVGRSRRWNRSGVVTECLPNRQYRVRLHDTGNTTLRSRRFLKPVGYSSHHRGPYSGPTSGPNVQPTEPPMVEEERNAQQSQMTANATGPLLSAQQSQMTANATGPPLPTRITRAQRQVSTTARNSHNWSADPLSSGSVPPPHSTALPSRDPARPVVREPLALRKLRPHNNPGLREWT